MTEQCQAGGMRCDEVLAGLSDYLDGELPPTRLAQVQAHLRGCPACARFGADFTAAIRALAQAQPAAEEEPMVYQRLHDCLARARS